MNETHQENKKNQALISPSISKNTLIINYLQNTKVLMFFN